MLITMGHLRRNGGGKLSAVPNVNDERSNAIGLSRVRLVRAEENRRNASGMSWNPSKNM